MYCVNCGKEKDIFRDGLCVECYVRDNIFTEGPDIINIIKCAHCGAYQYKNNWTNEDFKDVFKREILNKFKIRNELENIDIISNCDVNIGETVCDIIISGYLKNVNVKEEHKLTIRFKTTVCDVCSKRYGGYHEAIIQIRADKRKLTTNELDEIRVTVENMVENIRDKGNRALFITDIGEEHGGFDFFLSDKSTAQAITKKIQEKFGGTIKQSSKNIGMKDSRQIYRMTYLLRLPPFRKGDFISYQNVYFNISSISGSKVHVLELSNWKKRVFDSRELGNVIIHGGIELIKEMILVSQSINEVQVMDMNNYKTFYIRKPKKVNFDSKLIKLVRLDNELFLIT